MDRDAWCAVIHGVTKSRTWLNWTDWTEGWASGLCKLPMRWYLCWVFCFVLLSLMGKAEWGGNPVCWLLGLYFHFVCCFDEASYTECYWWLGDAGSCIQVVSFVWVLTILFSLGLVLCYSRVLESVLPLQSLRAWSHIWKWPKPGRDIKFVEEETWDSKCASKVGIVGCSSVFTAQA